MLSNAEPRLTSIATCLLLQASILGAGWLLQGWYLPQAPLQSHGPSQAQARTGSGAADMAQGSRPASADGDRSAAA